jgi:hypothetical protein
MVQLDEDLGGQTAIIEMTGLKAAYVSAHRRVDNPMVGAVDADIIQLLVDRLKLDAMWFFEEWGPGEKRSYRLYSLENRRLAKVQDRLELDQEQLLSAVKRQGVLLEQALDRIAQLEAGETSGKKRRSRMRIARDDK